MSVCRFLSRLCKVRYHRKFPAISPSEYCRTCPSPPNDDTILPESLQRPPPPLRIPPRLRERGNLADRSTTTKYGVSINDEKLNALKTWWNSVNYSPLRPPVFRNSHLETVVYETTTFRDSPNRYSLEFVSIPDARLRGRRPYIHTRAYKYRVYVCINTHRHGFPRLWTRLPRRLVLVVFPSTRYSQIYGNSVN